MQFQNNKEKVLIIDFGSQVTKLIARRVRELGVYSEIITPKDLNKLKKFHNIKGLIFSGGPSTVTATNFQRVPQNIFEKKIPILGICYGLQLIAKIFGGKIKSSKKKREFGRTILYRKNTSLLTKNFLNNKSFVWMSHEDAVVKLPKKFKLVASTKESKLTIIENTKNKIYGVQFHPEVTHTDKGKQLFKNFLFLICKIKKKWHVASQKQRLINEIKNTVMLLNPKNEEAIYNLARLKLTSSDYKKSKELNKKLRSICSKFCSKSDQLKIEIENLSKK